MSQAQVMVYLKEHKGWYTSKEIAKGVSTGKGSITLCLRKLRRFHFLKFKHMKEKGYIYKHK